MLIIQGDEKCFRGPPGSDNFYIFEKSMEKVLLSSLQAFCLRWKAKPKASNLLNGPIHMPVSVSLNLSGLD